MIFQLGSSHHQISFQPFVINFLEQAIIGFSTYISDQMSRAVVTQTAYDNKVSAQNKIFTPYRTHSLSINNERNSPCV